MVMSTYVWNFSSGTLSNTQLTTNSLPPPPTPGPFEFHFCLRVSEYFCKELLLYQAKDLKWHQWQWLPCKSPAPYFFYSTPNSPSTLFTLVFELLILSLNVFLYPFFQGDCMFTCLVPFYHRWRLLVLFLLENVSVVIYQSYAIPNYYHIQWTLMLSETVRNMNSL